MSNYNCLTMMILRRHHANYRELTSLINSPVKRLYVEADEDHVALQFHEKKGDIKRWKGHGDNTQIVKIVYVHEGIEKEGERARLKQPFYFGGVYAGEGNERLWKEVEDYIKKSYDTEKIEEIRFQSDGGAG